jgi:hypothetical protein
MRTAVESYATYRESTDRSALGRFIVPVSRLKELEEEGADMLPRGQSPDSWRLAVLVSGDAQAAAEEIFRFNDRHSSASAEGSAVIDVVELKAAAPREIERQHAAMPDSITQYFEIPVQGEIAPFVDILATVGARAKIRTGGVTSDAFPSAQDIISFIVGCHRKSVPFKATAGLHHPVRGSYRLTYDRGSASGMMFGFLNVFMAAALVHSGEGESAAREVLEETEPSAFSFTDDAIAWRGVSVALGRITALRSEFAISFGSCSFREPVEELAALDRSLMTSHR